MPVRKAETTQSNQVTTMSLKDYLATLRTQTRYEYQTTLKYLSKWSGKHHTFADFLLGQDMAQATRCKHLKQAQHLQKKG